MWSYYGKNYSCNPKAITEFLISQDSDYEIFWAFLPGKIPSDLPNDIKPVIFGSLKYLFVINTSEFIITNCRMFLMSTSWIKKRGQKYIMTWHSSMGLKCIEGDASLDSLGKPYVRAAKLDSKQCDLILSGSDARSKVIKRAFWYDGEILEKGTPRNDILFNLNEIEYCTQKVRNQYSIPNNASIVLYAPTFRESDSLGYYKICWDKVISRFKSSLHTEVYVLVRLHPNLIKEGLNTEELVDFKNVYDATLYGDMQELLLASDVLITDYSSSMFDFAYMKKPVFLHAIDYNTYDRDFYYDLNKLPFPFSNNNDELLSNIYRFDINDYIKTVSFFLVNEIGSFETGIANKCLYNWMQNHSLR